MLAPIVTAFEHAMTDGEGRNTWRTGRYSPRPREQAAGYLRFLVSVGYQLSAIEQAVADEAAYTGDGPAEDHFDAGPDQDGPAGSASGPDESGSGPVRDDGPAAADGEVPADPVTPRQDPATDQAA